ncbi:IS200/IS605 family transposase [candidate division WOR-3 bacterium]|nr:IS200/IS605 family transposase [candidate division WOR-3 bacterium]
MTRGYKRSRTSVHMLMYHFVWIPKRRKKILISEIKNKLSKLIKIKLRQINCEIIKMEIMPDHVHLFVSSNPLLSPNFIIGSVKGFTSRILRNEFPELRKIPSLWTRSYWVSSAGNVSQAVIKRYIGNQNAKN